jgi:hypothetical protein
MFDSARVKSKRPRCCAGRKLDDSLTETGIEARSLVRMARLQFFTEDR